MAHVFFPLAPNRPQPQVAFLGPAGAGIPPQGPPPRTASAPPEQQGMLSHSVQKPNFIPDKSTAPRPANVVVAPGQQSPNLAPSLRGQFVPQPGFTPQYPPTGFVPRQGYGGPPGQPPQQQQFVQPPYAYTPMQQGQPGPTFVPYAPVAGAPVFKQAAFGGEPVPPVVAAAAQVPSPAKKASAAIVIVNPDTGKPVQFSKPALKFTAAAFEPKSAPSATSPRAAAPAAAGDAPAAAVAAPAAVPAAVHAPGSEAKVVVSSSHPSTAGEITRPGRWKPPADDAAHVAKDAGAATPPPVAEVPKVAEPVKVAEQPKPVEQPKADPPKEVKTEAPKVVERVPEKVEVEPEHKTEHKTEHKAEHKEERAEPAKDADQAKEEWELVNTADLGREVEQRVAASQLEEDKEEPVAAMGPKKIEAIRYDEISYNPLEDKDGKKKYSKDFLMQFRPFFTTKPADLEDLDIFDGAGDAGGGGRGGRENSRDRDRSPNRGGRGNRDRNSVGSSRAAEQWEKGREGGQGGGGRDQGGRYDRRGGGGGGGGGGSSKDRYGKSREPPKPTGPPVEPLVRSESGWKPEKVDTSTEEGTKLALVKEAQGHLNKMTQVTYEKLSGRLVVIANKEAGPPPLPGLLREIINKVFEQALQQPTFCGMYASLCAKISRFTKDFRRELLNKCQEEFESDAVEPPAELSQPEKDMLRFKAKKRMLGNIKFICELYKQKMLLEDIMHSCIARLLKQDLLNPDEEQTEALCDFLVRIGKLLDRPGAEKLMESYFQKLETMKNGPNIGARLRFMVEDVCDFRNSGWKPGKGGPKAVLRGAKSSKESAKAEEEASKGGKGASPAKAGKGAAPPQKAESQWKEVTKSGNKQGQQQASNKDRKGAPGAAPRKDDRDAGKKGVAVRASPGGRDDKKDDRRQGGGAAAAAGSRDRNSGGRGRGASPSSPSVASRDDDEDSEVASPVKAASAAADSGKDSNERFIPAVHSAIDEFWDTQDIDGVIYAIEKDFPENYRPQFIFEALKHSLMRSEKERERLIDCFFAPELTEGIFTKPVLRAGIQLVIDALADMSMDHPAAPRKVASLFARSVNEELHSFKELWSLFDVHIEEGRGFGVCGETLGATLKCLSQSSSVEKIKELLATNHFTNVAAKLPPSSRNEVQYNKFLTEFDLVDCFPALSLDAVKAKTTPAHSPSPSPSIATKEGQIKYKRAEDAFADDALALKLYQGLTKSNEAEVVESVCGKELFGDFKVAKSAFKAFLEYWLRLIPVAGVEKVMPSDMVKKEAKMIKDIGVPLLKFFTGSDTGEVGDIILEVYEWFLAFHGKEVNSAFYMRSLQYWHAYKFISTAKVSEYGQAGQGQLNQSCLRMFGKIQAMQEADRAGKAAPAASAAAAPKKE